MTALQSKSFENADEVRTPDKTRVEVVRLDGVTAGRFTFEPGWKWSECVKPKVGTDTCQAHHVGAVVSGRLHVEMADGSEMDLGPGDAYIIPSGHDAWNTGDVPTVLLEFESAETYAK